MTPHLWIGLAALLFLDGVALGVGLTIFTMSDLRCAPLNRCSEPAGGLPSSVPSLSSVDETAAASPTSKEA